jgi:hypothetical protein
MERMTRTAGARRTGRDGMMAVAEMVVKVVVFALLGCAAVGGPLVLADRVGMRRQATAARQIALTDALDAQFGALVAPEVRKPLFGPWEVRMALPPLGSAVLAGILAVIDAMFAGMEGTSPVPYRVDLRVTPTSYHAGPDRWGPRLEQPRAGTPVAA